MIPCLPYYYISLVFLNIQFEKFSDGKINSLALEEFLMKTSTYYHRKVIYTEIKINTNEREWNTLAAAASGWRLIYSRIFWNY